MEKIFLSFMKPENRLLAVAENGYIHLQRFRKLSQLGRFEVLLFNSALVTMNREKDETYYKFIGRISSEAKVYDLSDVSDELVKFILYKIKFYGDLIESLTDPNFNPSFIYHFFYEDPCSVSLEFDHDVIASFEFYPYLIEMINYVHKQIK
jgi:hypothetical protein